MTPSLLQSTFAELGVPDYIARANEGTLARTIASTATVDTAQPKPERLPRFGFVYENEGVLDFQRWVASQDVNDLASARANFQLAFICWRALDSLDSFSGSQPLVGMELVESELGGEPVSGQLRLAFRLAATGLVAQRTAETRLVLQHFDFPDSPSDIWRDRVADRVIRAFTLLVRKADGWNDIDQALSAVEDLRRLQKAHEDSYIADQGDDDGKTRAAMELVGFYHLAQLITIVGEYLRDGKDSITQVSARLDRHVEQATTAFRNVEMPLLLHITGLVWVGCRELAQNAIWTHVAGLGPVQQFAKLLAGRGRPHPIVELWPSQQDALRRNLLDPYPRAILVEMPTSAGKTLLAKFSIVQTKALNPASTIAYIVPTRALVNQVTLDLRADFGGMTPPLRVEQTVSAFELDPTEDRLLQFKPDVLVTTPEKLDLLVRSDHSVTQDLSLIIADEAHNIRERGRGPRLELLLGTIKRDRANARFLLLSPFLPNDKELVQWLGEDRFLPPISVDWKPSSKMVGAVSLMGRGHNRALVFETLPSADNQDVRPEMKIPIGPKELVRGNVGISTLTCATTRALVARGSVLVLCRGKGTALNRARELAAELPEQSEPSEFLEAVRHYIAAEIGPKSALVDCLRHRVAYHHAGLSHEVRWLIETLISRGEVAVVCGTTTLAQGVNFPITTVVVESLEKGDTSLTYQDFWNIAGRAGRALVDCVGVVAFPSPDRSRRAEYAEFLEGEALEISSQLARLIDRADEIGDHFDLATMYNVPELSTLLQFLAHAMRVSGVTNIADDVEDLLRSSLVYHQTRRVDEEAARRLVRLCRSYLQQIGGQKGILSLADKTGFATPSVLKLLAERGSKAELGLARNWNPDRLFGDDLSPLSARIKAIGDLPEIRLGQGTGGLFNPERVASILRDWVKGESLEYMASRYSILEESDLDKKVSQFSSYLFSELLGRASWGIGALEVVCRAGDDEASWDDAGHIPSMIFFGVRRKEAVWLRMVGVPRLVADGLATLWQRSSADDPSTYDSIRIWVDSLGDADWLQAIPANSSVTPTDMRLLWRRLAG